MADTTIASTSDTASAAPERPSRQVRPPRGLPAGRAVVGALLVTAAAVVTFAAYLDATAAPSVRYVVATATVEPGTRLDTLSDVGERFGTIAIDLPPEVAGATVPGREVEELVGQVIVAPLAAGDLLSRSQVAGLGDVPGTQTLSFSLPRRAAVAGALRPGERIDVLATRGSGEAAYTAYVVRGVPLLRVAAPDGGPLVEGNEVLLTVAVSALEDVQALGHAVATAELLVTRSTARRGDDDPSPGAYRPQPSELGPRPDPADWTVRDGGPDGAAADPDADAGDAGAVGQAD